MNAEATVRAPVELQGEEQICAEQNRGAVLTMWIGFGSILCLLLSCLLGSLFRSVFKLEITVAILAALLLASVLIFFLGGKKDARWYFVCALLNHSGIGLAVLLLLNVLGLEIRLLQLAVSGLPAAAILFGVVMFYIGAYDAGRSKFLYGGLVLLVLICGAALLRCSSEQTEFWLCMAICALLSCAGLGALIWANKEPEQRSIYKGLAVASFSVYLLVLAAAAAAILVMSLGSGSSSNSRSSRSKKSGSGKSGASGRSGLGVGSLLSGLGTKERSTAFRSRRSFYFPTYLWYYTPMTRYSAIDRMEGLSDADREEERRRYQRRRVIALAVVVLIVLAVIFAAVAAGRG